MMKIYVKNHDPCYIEMLEKSENILKYNHGEKSIKILFIIHANIEFLLEKLNIRHDNPEKPTTTTINSSQLFIIFTLFI